MQQTEGYRLAFFEDFIERYVALSAVERGEFLDDFILLMSDSDVKDLVRKLEGLPSAVCSQTSKDITDVIDNQTVRQVIQNITEVQQDRNDTKEDGYECIKLYSNSAKTPTKTNVFVKKRMLIHVDFSGLGSEHRFNHPAIVWYTDEAKGDRMVVIPCTSYKPDTTMESTTDINIGKAKFFGGTNNVEGELLEETVVLLNQIQVVSRKRITGYWSRNPITGQSKTARIDFEQVRRIEEGLKIMMHEEKTLYDLYIQPYEIQKQVSMFPTATMVPEFVNHENQYKHIYRIPYEVEDNGCFISYKVEGDPNTYYMFRRPTTRINSEEHRKALLKNWIRPRAIRNPDKTLHTDTPTVRENAYNALLAKKNSDYQLPSVF